jgi:hypothetical protein
MDRAASCRSDVEAILLRPVERIRPQSPFDVEEVPLLSSLARRDYCALYSLPVGLRNPSECFGAGFLAIKPPSHRSSKENLHFLCLRSVARSRLETVRMLPLLRRSLAAFKYCACRAFCGWCINGATLANYGLLVRSRSGMSSSASPYTAMFALCVTIMTCLFSFTTLSVFTNVLYMNSLSRLSSG